MKKFSKKTIYILVIVIIIILAIIGIIWLFNREEKNSDISQANNIEENVLLIEEVKKDVPEKLLNDRTYQTIIIKDVDILAIEGTTTFKAKVESNSEEDIKNKTVVLTFKNNNGEEITKIEYPIQELKKGETKDIDYCITSDISNIEDYTIDIVDNPQEDEEDF